MVTELVCMATGGPQRYSGKSMKESHKNFDISEKEWVAFAAEFQVLVSKVEFTL